jgi:hypothetical protein
MNTKVTLCALVMMCCGPLTALGDQFQLLAGTWVIDAEQTEEYLKKVGPPPQNANWIPAIVMRMCVTTMTFSDNALTRQNLGPQPFEESFQLTPKKIGASTFSLDITDGKEKDTLTISFLDTEYITIKSLKMEFMEYGVWKRGKKSGPQTGEKDFNDAFKSCATALGNVPFLKIK